MAKSDYRIALRAYVVTLAHLPPSPVNVDMHPDGVVARGLERCQLSRMIRPWWFLGRKYMPFDVISDHLGKDVGDGYVFQVHIHCCPIERRCFFLERYFTLDERHFIHTISYPMWLMGNQRVLS